MLDGSAVLRSTGSKLARFFYAKASLVALVPSAG